MKLQVEQAKEHVGTMFPYRYTEPASVLGDVAAFPWSRHDITISGEYWYDGQNFVVKGHVLTNGDYACSRCLQPTEYVNDVPFEETFGVVEYGQNEDELDFVPFNGEEIDLTDLIRETLIINEPYQVLCQEDCKGLCVHCGTDLNISSCSCDSFVVDPRLAVLRTLLDKKDD